MSFLRYSDDLKAAAANWTGRPAAPNDWSRQHAPAIAVYDNVVVENLFAKAHPITPLIWFGPLTAYGLFHAAGAGTSWWLTATLFVAGYLAWTLAEYLLHRYLFHLPVRERKLPFFLVHGYHHEFPRDRMRLVAPFIASWTGGALFLALYVLTLGPTLGWAMFAGTAAGYVAYDLTHYFTHHNEPRSRVGRYLRRHHMRHHVDPDRHFGISTPLWDWVFRTM